MKVKTLLGLALLVGAMVTGVAHQGARAADVQLLPNGLMEPASTEQVPANKFKKAAPWVIGMSWPGVGNTWIVQTIQEIKFAGSHDPNVKEFRFAEANWQPAKQVADIEDLMAHKVDALSLSRSRLIS